MFVAGNSGNLPEIAVIADAHYHDIHSDYAGAGMTAGDRTVTLRSWTDTRGSTRVFNESGAALRAALDRINQRGIRHIVLLGDYSDDGQYESTRRVAQLLYDYRQAHGMSFYALPGNHDVFGPLGRHRTTRIVTGPGTSVLVTSAAKHAATEPATAILTDRMYCEGMPAALIPMAEFGYFNAPDYHHWETPFGTSDAFDRRTYVARSADGTVEHRLVDGSYLVEPEPGLWLLMIDANVFEPRPGPYRLDQKAAFIDPTDAGWNALLRVKPFLVDWIADVCARSRALGKTLLAFSHYPVVDPFDDVEDAESSLFGETEIVRRRPLPCVGEALAKAGLHRHFSGHYHVNSTTELQTGSGKLTNVAVPSLVAFPPCFKVLRPAGDTCAIDTVSVGDIATDNLLMDSYRAEIAALGLPGDPALDTADYATFLYSHTHSRVAQHVLGSLWPPDIASRVKDADVADLIGWFSAEPRQPSLTAFAGKHALDATAIKACPLSDLIGDWYCLRQAGPAAVDSIPADRMRLYRALVQEFGNARPEPGNARPEPGDDITRFLAVFLGVLGVSIRRMDAGQ